MSTLYKRTFFDIFPPPRFLAMPAAGLDISDRSIRFAELVKDKTNLVLGKYGEKNIPEGVVEAGEIKDPEAMAAILSELREEYGFSFVRISLPEQQSYLLRLALPHVRQDEIRETIELRLEGKVPISPEEAVFDYTRITCNAANNETLPVGVAVLPRAITEQYLSIVQKAGLTPLSFELEAHAISRTVLPPDDCGTYMIVDIGATRTGISIVSEGVVHFTTTLSIGGTLLTNAVARSFNLPFKEAQQQKEKYGLAQSDTETMSYFSALMPAVSSLRDEIKRYYLYWLQHAEAEDETIRGTPIDSIILCGGEANVPGLREYLSSSLKERVRKADPWRNIADLSVYTPEIPYNHSLRYVTALGLALRSFE